MTAMQKTSRISETRRSGTEVALPGGGSRALATAAETPFSIMAECQLDLIDFVSMWIGKDGDAFRQMMSCKNVGDVSAINLRWMEAAGLE